MNLLWTFIISFLFMLPTYNKMWAPYDEGNYLITARMAMEGMIPYKDFFFIMYPPGQAYALAGLFKIFGTNLFVGRLYNIILLSAICACVFCITSKVASRKHALLAFIVTLITMASLGEPPIPRSIWPGIMFSLFATLFLLEFIEKDKLGYLLLSGLFIGITTLFRHDIGFLTFISGSVGLLAYAGKRALKPWIAYAALPVIFISAMACWLYKVGALGDAFRAIFILPATFYKWGAIPFPKFCLDFSMIFHGDCLFIKDNKFYIPILLYGASSWFLFTEFIAKRKLDKRFISLMVVLILGIAYLQQLVFRVDDNHLAVAFPPSAILFAALFTYKTGYRSKFFKMAKPFLISYISLSMILFSYHAIERYIKEAYMKPFVKMETRPVHFKQGTIYLPDDTADIFTALAKYVEQNTEEGDKIYLGPLRHNEPQFGWFELLYFVTNRLPAVKYYIIAPGFQTRSDIQEEMILSLEESGAKVLLLRDYGDAPLLGPLDRYIQKKYRLDKIMDSYRIYVKK